MTVFIGEDYFAALSRISRKGLRLCAGYFIWISLHLSRISRKGLRYVVVHCYIAPFEVSPELAVRDCDTTMQWSLPPFTTSSLELAVRDCDFPGGHHVSPFLWAGLELAVRDCDLSIPHQNMSPKNRTKEYIGLIRKNIEAIEGLLYLIQEDGKLPTPDAEADAVEIARHIRSARQLSEMLYKRVASTRDPAPMKVEEISGAVLQG